MVKYLLLIYLKFQLPIKNHEFTPTILDFMIIFHEKIKNSEKTKNEQIMKMFCNDIKEINSQNEVNYYYNHSVDGLLYTVQLLQETFKLQKF